MPVRDGLENQQNRITAIHFHLHFRAIPLRPRHGPAGGGGDAVLRREIQQPAHAHIRRRRGGKERQQLAAGQRRPEARLQFVLRQAAFLKKLFHQRIIRGRHRLDERLVHRLRLLSQIAFRRCRRALAHAVRFVRHHFLRQHVEHLIESRSRIYRHRQRRHAVAQRLAHARQCRVEIHMLLVHPVERHELRQTLFLCPADHLCRAHLHAFHGIYHHHRAIRHTQCRLRFAEEIEVARRVNHVQLFACPLRVHQRGADGNLPLMFRRLKIRRRRAGINAAQPVDHAAQREHALGQHGFARAGMAHEREITNIL